MDIRDAIGVSFSWSQFVKEMEKRGYTWKLNRKYPALKTPDMERYVRLRSLGKGYGEAEIREKILRPKIQQVYGKTQVQFPKRKLTGLQKLYFSYLYRMGVLQQKPKRISYAVRSDIRKLDLRIRQMEFLSKNNIDTLAQLETYRQALQTEIRQLLTKRKQLPKTDDVQSQHESVNTALKQLRQEERLCRKIAEHSLEVQQHLTEARRDRAEQQKQEQERARDRRPNIDLTL